MYTPIGGLESPHSMNWQNHTNEKPNIERITQATFLPHAAGGNGGGNPPPDPIIYRRLANTILEQPGGNPPPPGGIPPLLRGLTVQPNRLNLESFINGVQPQLVGDLDLDRLFEVPRTDYLKLFADLWYEKVKFFHPIKYAPIGEAAKAHGFKAKAVEFFDSYFHLGGNVVYISQALSNKKGRGFLYQSLVKPSWYMIALKVISYATLVLPAIMLVGKAIARSLITYEAFLFTKNSSSMTEQNEQGSDHSIQSDSINEDDLSDDNNPLYSNGEGLNSVHGMIKI